MNLLLMADGNVGAEIATWLMKEHSADLRLLVTTCKNSIFETASQNHLPTIAFESGDQVCQELAARQIRPDVGVLAWWPYVIKYPLLSVPIHGFINTHPSLLPHNRGKHYNFWAIVERAPFGVSLHFVDEGIDSGDVVAQEQIYYGWEDTGGTLYAKATIAMVDLFKRSYPMIRRLEFKRSKQDRNVGSFHHGSELETASRIYLDKPYGARELLNLLRARTFPGRPACTFGDGGAEYEVRIEIKRKA